MDWINTIPFWDWMMIGIIVLEGIIIFLLFRVMMNVGTAIVQMEKKIEYNLKKAVEDLSYDIDQASRK